VRNRRVSRRTAVALIVGGDLLLLALGWFMLVSPQRSTAKSIARAADAAEVQIAQAKLLPSHPKAPVQPKQPEIRTAYLYKLSKAMPMTTDMPNLLLELNQVVHSAGVQLTSIGPSPTDPSGVTSVSLLVSGDFYSLTDLLYRLRSLVTVRDGELDVSGRLISVKSVDLTPTGTGRTLNASITLDTYNFGTSTPGLAPVPTTTAATTSTTGASTAAATTTTSSPAADAAP
jgi:Tfp pilus assembly protein PilO